MWKGHFPREEYEDRWARVDRAMAECGIETAVVWGRTASTFDRAGDLIWLANYFSTKVGQGFDAPPHNARAFAAVILRRGHEPELHADDPDVRADLTPMRHFRAHADPVAGVVAALQERGISGPVAFVGTDFFPVKYWNQLVAETPNIAWQPADDLVRRVRMVKSARECDAIREAGAIATRALTAMCEALAQCRTEAEAAALAAAEIVRGGGVVDKIQVSHGTDIGYTCGDPLTGYRTIAPKPGDLTRFFVIGPMFQGYYLDPGRTIVAGGSPNSGQRDLIESTAGIVAAIEQAVRPGVAYRDAAAIGDRMVADFGPDSDPAAEKFPFFGHPHGLYFEGPPYISTALADEDAVFAENTLIGIEAFLARNGVGNAAIEQNYLVGPDGLELITETPIHL